MKEISIRDAGMKNLLANMICCAKCPVVQSIYLTEVNTVKVKCCYADSIEFPLKNGITIQCPFNKLRNCNPNFVIMGEFK
ncbi:MAG: hypothetical protein ACTSWC_00680 [Promethearchaeota archaeon]